MKNKPTSFILKFFLFPKGIIFLVLIFFLCSKVLLAEDKNLTFEDSLIAFEHFVNADILENIGQRESSLKEYQSALEILPQDNNIRFSYAQALFRMGKFSEALVEALKIEPKDADNWFLLGEGYRLLNEREKAKEAYKNCVALDSTNLSAYWSLALIYQRDNDVPNYISAWKNVSRLKPFDSNIHFQLVDVFIQLRDYPDALVELDKILQMDSQNKKALYKKAEIFEQQNNLPSAVEIFEVLLKQDSTNIDWNTKLLDLHLKNQNLIQSILVAERLTLFYPEEERFKKELSALYITAQKYKQADSILVPQAKKKPTDFSWHFLLGKSKQASKSYKDAEIEFKKTVELNDSLVAGWTSLAQVFVSQDNLEKAKETLKQGLEKVLQKKELFYALGTVYYQLKNYDSSIQNLYTAVKLDSLNKYYLFQLGAAYEQGGYFTFAESTFQKVIAIDSGFAPALNYLGYMYADSGINLEISKYLIEKALQIEPVNGAYLDSHAWVLFKLGELTQAEEQIRKALLIIDNDPIIYEHLGDILEKQGRKKEAIEQWEKALKLNPKEERLREKLKKFGLDK